MLDAAATAPAWYARACGLPGFVPEDNIKKTFGIIQEYNIDLFQGGEMGALNGMRSDGRIDTSSDQAQEVWVGTNYALAAAMIQEGLDEEGFALAKSVVNMTYKELGYWFQTPEAWDYMGNFRSLAYMRPLAIWAIQWALEQRKK
jgi:non-lysosomal glucosylceramidase